MMIKHMGKGENKSLVSLDGPTMTGVNKDIRTKRNFKKEIQNQDLS